MWNDDQASLIVQSPRDTVVYASPGSGKTAVLVGHGAEVLRSRQVTGEGLMMLSFTRQSAQELRRRLFGVSHVPRQVLEAARVGTFHGQAFRMLTHLGVPVFAPLRRDEQRQLAREALRSVGMLDNTSLNRFLLWCQAAKNCGRTPDSVPKGFARASQKYEYLKQMALRWDYEDILLRLLDEMGRRPAELREHLRTEYVLVDEFQDVNDLQWAILQRVTSLLSIPLVAVGDDDQSIYGFRGGSPKWLIDFPAAYPQCRQSVLAVNYRSDLSIVNASSQLIAHNRTRVVKPHKAYRERAGQVMALWHPSEEAEANFVLHQVLQISRNFPTLAQAVLARTRLQLQWVWRNFTRLSIPNVEFRTFHDAKGREWPVVHLIGAVEPNPYLATNQPDIEEERRLFYVGMTRAQYILTIHGAASIHRIQRPLSFIAQSGTDIQITGGGSQAPDVDLNHLHMVY